MAKESKVEKAELKSESKAENILKTNDQNQVSKETEQESVQEVEQPKDSAKTEKPLAKAGKRSAKAVAESQEKVAKEERKASSEENSEDAKPKKPVKPTRSRLERRGKKYREAAKQIDKTKQYSLKEALQLVTKTSTTKFDATVELHIRLNVDPKQADQNIRDNIVLPNGSGKTVRVAVFSDDDGVKAAKAAGADVAGTDDFLQQLDKGVIDFDVLIASPNVMAKLSKYARVLGPKGLMPNPKSGTVTADVAKGVKESKAGRLEYRVDSTGIIHVGVGKTSFGAEKLIENANVLIASIKSNKPASLKSTYVRTIALTSTMGPSIAVLPSELS